MSSTSAAGMSRRHFRQLSAVGVAVVGGGRFAGTRVLGGPQTVGPGAVAVILAEGAPRAGGRILRRDLRAAPTDVDLAGRIVRTCAYDGVIPGKGIRLGAGDELGVRVTNSLPAETTVHWHALAVSNDMDGVPGLTQDAVPPSGALEYAQRSRTRDVLVSSARRRSA